MRKISNKVEFEIPDELKEDWEKLLETSGMNESELLFDLIEDELTVMKTGKEKESYDRMEDAAREVHENLGSEGLERFSEEVRLIAKKLVESEEGL